MSPILLLLLLQNNCNNIKSVIHFLFPHWRPETKQGIEGKIVSFRPGRVSDRVGDRVRVRGKDHRSEPDRRSEAINFGAC